MFWRKEGRIKREDMREKGMKRALIHPRTQALIHRSIGSGNEISCNLQLVALRTLDPSRIMTRD